MNINFTVFIQAFHFFIAYLIVERFFLRSVLQSINQEQQHYNDLIATINTQQQHIKDKEERKLLEWNAIKLFFAKTIPHIQPQEQLVRPGTIKSDITLSKQKQQEYEQELQKVLVKRLSHVS
jgi:hypothetical protein